MKKLLSTVLALMMLITTLTATGVNAFASTYSDKCGDNAYWKLDTSTGVLNVSGSGAIYDYGDGYDGDDAPWHNYFERYITSIIIENGITRVGDYAFAYPCNSYISDVVIYLDEVNIPESVQEIGKFAFHSVVGKNTKLTLKSGLKKIDDGAFFNCGMTSINIPDTVTKIEDYAFEYCNNMTAYNVSASNKNYSSSGGALFNKAKTILYVVPGGKTITSYTVPKTVKTIYKMAFSHDSTKVSSPLGSSLKKVVISDSVTKIGENAFARCYALKTVVFGKSVKTIEGGAFSRTSLTSVTLPNSLTTIGDSAFWNTDIKSIKFGNKLKTIGSGAFASLFNLKSVTIPNSVTSVGGGAFEGCYNLTKLVLSTNIKKIPSYFAYDCPNLKSIYIPSSVTSIANGSLGRYYYSDTQTKTVKNFKIYSKGNKAAINYAKKYSGITHVKVSVPKLAFKSVTPVSKGFKASWTKNTKMDGYQIQYATDSKFTKNKKTVTETDETKASKTIKNLTAKKKYYVRVRNYKRYAGAQVFSAWSGTKSVTTKK